MSVREGIRTYLSDRDMLRASLYLAGALGLALLATWPRGPLETALQTGAASDTFTVVAICFLLAVIYLGARWGAEDTTAEAAAAGAASQLHEYAMLTPVSLLSLVSGRCAAGVLHTLLLLLLGAPFIVAATAVGGAGIADVFLGLAIIGAAGLAARMAGLLALALLGTRRVFREIFLFIVLAAAFGPAFFFAPAVSPFSALTALLRPAVPSAPILCVLANLGVAVIFAAFALLVLAGVRARAARTARTANAANTVNGRHA